MFFGSAEVWLFLGGRCPVEYRKLRHSAYPMTDNHYDFIIVGAGSAGCVIANRLSANPDTRVLLVEAGPMDRSVFIHMPAAFSYPLNDNKFNWRYRTEPEPFMDGRIMDCPRGRVLGGSSSINGMAYVRGNALDYDRWGAETGFLNWSYAHVLPYFKSAETRVQGADDYHGGSGPLMVSTGPGANPLFKAFVDAGVEAGYPFTKDQNGYQQEGFGSMDMTVYKGERWSAAKAYLRPIGGRDNLRVVVNALSSRIVFEGTRAVGLEYSHANRSIRAHASTEVIVCGGAINSPQLLQLSGVGDAELLRKHNIPVVMDLPGVGNNLQDHLETYVQHTCTEPVSLYPALKPLTKLKIGIQWMLFRTGWGTSSHFEAGAFIRSRAGVPHPDLQYHFLPIAANYDGQSPAAGHGFQAHVGPMRPTSRGHVRIKSKDPRTAPSIQFNYMGTEGDRQEMRDAVRLTREIFAQSAFDRLRGPELAPGDAVQSDDQIDAFIRSHGESAYHPSCTCKMGSDPEAVVDGAARVRGINSLRVVDASIMPSIVSGNLNAPTIMLGEKCADLILGNDALPPLNVPVYRVSDYETRQR